MFNSNQSWSQDFEVVRDGFSEAYLVVKTCDRFFFVFVSLARAAVWLLLNGLLALQLVLFVLRHPCV